MSKARKFLDSFEPQAPSSLATLASTLAEAGDSRLQDLVAAGATSDNVTEALLALALNLHLNGDDSLWNELQVNKLIKESADVAAQVETLKAQHEAKLSKAGRFLSELGKFEEAVGRESRPWFKKLHPDDKVKDIQASIKAADAHLDTYQKEIQVARDAEHKKSIQDSIKKWKSRKTKLQKLLTDVKKDQASAPKKEPAKEPDDAEKAKRQKELDNMPF